MKRQIIPGFHFFDTVCAGCMISGEDSRTRLWFRMLSTHALLLTVTCLHL